MLDVARHFFTVDEVKTFIDSTSALKFTHLHLHLSDDQGWRVHIDSWPLSTELSSSTVAGGDPGGFYTKDDYREIVSYAAEQHLLVIPEIDLPGHTHAFGIAYPDLVEEPVLNDSLMAESARLGQPLPVAGESYLGWVVGRRRSLRRACDRDHRRSREDAGRVARDRGRQPTSPRAPSGSTGARPHRKARMRRKRLTSSSAGGALILSAADVTYLDMKYTETFPLGLTWAAIIDVRSAYEWEPTEILEAPDDAIFGIEAPLWSETTRTLREVEQLVFPRAAVQAEVAWSPRAAAEHT